MSNKDWRIGIDVGGTNTDAVVLDENLNLISAVKSPTTEDVMSGIENAMEAVLAGEGVESFPHRLRDAWHDALHECHRRAQAS